MSPSMVVMVTIVCLLNSQSGGGFSAQSLQNNLERSGTVSYQPPCYIACRSHAVILLSSLSCTLVLFLSTHLDGISFQKKAGIAGALQPPAKRVFSFTIQTTIQL
jgi:hypothetical protein